MQRLCVSVRETLELIPLTRLISKEKTKVPDTSLTRNESLLLPLLKSLIADSMG